MAARLPPQAVSRSWSSTRSRHAYKEQFDLVWLERSPANNTQALAVKREFAEENGLATISDLAAIVGDLVISAPADFPERQDGLLGLQRVYGAGFNDVEVLPVAPGVKYQALLDDQAQVVLAFGTDGQIAGYDLVVLEDDLNLWPPYNVAPGGAAGDPRCLARHRRTLQRGDHLADQRGALRTQLAGRR